MPDNFHPSGAAHTPVMLSEVLKALNPSAGEVYVDGTFGAGGYTKAILDHADCRVIAIDRDPNAIEEGQKLLTHYKSRLTLVHATFEELRESIKRFGLTHVDGIVLDVGVSSMQLDQAARGFSFMRDGPLDMRMSTTGQSAADRVNKLDQSDLSRVIFMLGDEPRARAIAREIVEARTEKELTTTFDLVRAIERATGPQRAKDRIHPATRTFQALRILVNSELTQLAGALFAAEDILREGGRLVVVTFHSLEDRIVKRFFTLRSGKAPHASRHQPGDVTQQIATFSTLFRGHQSASEHEMIENPRSRSAKLRAGIRTSKAVNKVSFGELGVPEIGRELRA
jgi:16S rRNA (cytosine1402-N4)-methyltransferase